MPLAIFESCLLLAPCCAGVSSSQCDFHLKAGISEVRCSWAAAKPLRKTTGNPSGFVVDEES